MATKQSYERKYGDANSKVVLSSKGKVAAAGRWSDRKQIEQQRLRHRELMANLP